MNDEDVDYDDLESVLRFTRRQFTGSFADHCREIHEQWQAAAAGDRSVLPALQKRVHQMAGLAGTVGFPTVSNRGAILDRLIARWTATGADAAEIPRAIALMRDAFDDDMKTQT